jgi:predicted RNase H-like HicB family nuclease
MKLSIRVTENAKGSFTAYCPDLPGCVSQGGSQEEATNRLLEVVRGYLAAVSNFVPDQIECEIGRPPALGGGEEPFPARTGATRRPHRV